MNLDVTFVILFLKHVIVMDMVQMVIHAMTLVCAVVKPIS